MNALALANSAIPLSFSSRSTFRSRFAPVSCSVAPRERLKSQSVDRKSVAGAGDAEDSSLSGIHVPREKYISLPKAELLHGLMSLFESEDDADEFARFSRCLDSVLHAEHKVLLEELRLYYSLASLQEERGNCSQAVVSQQQLVPNGFTWKMGINGQVVGDDDRGLLYNIQEMKSRPDKFFGDEKLLSDSMSRVDQAANFQHAFMKLLRDAKFEEISANDLRLTRVLKLDYLLRLPIFVDWKRALDSNAIIFRRGYATEKQTGLLIVEKLDYLQSKFLQNTFFLLSKPLKKIGIWISKALEHFNKNEKNFAWMEGAKDWLTEQSIHYKMRSYIEGKSNGYVVDDQSKGKAFPIWLAAQRAVPLYEGLLSPVGPRGRLMRKLLSWAGLVPSTPEIPYKVDKENKNSESYLRPNFLRRITLSDIWRPASKEYCGNNLWETFKTGVTILFTKSLLQEPAFQQLILLYTDDDRNQKESKMKSEVLPLRLKIYERIPIPDLPVIFPHRKLSFRILDTIRLDIASILGLLAYFVNYKFETIISSPSAFFLDVVAIGALIIYGSRVILGYKQTWDRYQLLVNRTLYEKTLASGFGSVHFLLDASEQQQHKEAILAYALLLHSKDQISSHKSIKDACEKFMHDKFTQKIEMPIDSAIETLLRLEIVNETHFQENLKVEALSCSKACDALKHRWDKLLQRHKA